MLENMKLPVTARQKELLAIIYEYIKNADFPPTIEEMKKKLGVVSNQSVLDLLGKLRKKGMIRRNEGSARNIAILPLGYEMLGRSPLAPVLGVAAAGYPIEAIEVSGEWRELPGGLSKLQSGVFMIKIFGDSMINAGIDDGDVVLVQDKKEFVSGDVVLAQKEGEATVKRFISEDKPPYVYLKPENPNYGIIPFTDSTELQGKVISIFKNGYWKSIK